MDQNAKKLLFSKVIKRYCTEICKEESCEKCQVVALSEWLSKNVVVLYHFQLGQQFIVDQEKTLLALFDLIHCKSCESFKMNHQFNKEVLVSEEKVKERTIDIVDVDS